MCGKLPKIPLHCPCDRVCCETTHELQRTQLFLEGNTKPSLSTWETAEYVSRLSMVYLIRLLLLCVPCYEWSGISFYQFLWHEHVVYSGAQNIWGHGANYYAKKVHCESRKSYARGRAGITFISRKFNYCRWIVSPKCSSSSINANVYSCENIIRIRKWTNSHTVQKIWLKDIGQETRASCVPVVWYWNKNGTLQCVPFLLNHTAQFPI